MSNPRPLVEHGKSKDDIPILTGAEVQALLAGKERDVIGVVRAAYEAHARHERSLPHSTFLRFPHSEKDRIIALPAYLGGEFNAAGIKWIASFPDNVARGVARASAVIILNSAACGRPEAILEGSIISAKKTAASAALAAIHLKGDRPFRIVGIIGCGVINFEIARFLTAMLPEIASFLIFDLQGAAAEHFREKCRETFDTVDVSRCADWQGSAGWAHGSLRSSLKTELGRPTESAPPSKRIRREG